MIPWGAEPGVSDMDPKADVTAILAELSRDGTDPKVSPEQLLPQVYDQLRRLAGSYFQRERAGHTLQPTALVHEAYERLADQSRVEWKGRTHFFAVAANGYRIRAAIAMAAVVAPLLNSVERRNNEPSQRAQHARIDGGTCCGAVCTNPQCGQL